MLQYIIVHYKKGALSMTALEIQSLKQFMHAFLADDTFDRYYNLQYFPY